MPTSTPIESQLWNAVSNGDLPLVEALIDQGANVSRRHWGRTYLEIAAQNSLYNRASDMLGYANPWVPVIELLIRHGADPKQVNSEGLTPYEHYCQYVSWYPNPDVKRLLENGGTPLRIAS